jgi:alpha-tubulin suppressor-like RCC1 family protein
MALLSMILFILGAGGLLLGGGWTLFAGGPTTTNLKPAFAGLALMIVAWLLPIGGGLNMADAPAPPPPPPPQPPLHQDGAVPINHHEPNRKQLATSMSISVRLRSACSTDATGTPTCWGEPAPLTGQATTRITFGRDHGCALLATGEAECWGSAEESRDDSRNKPFVDMSATLENTCGITAQGALHCWGENSLLPPANHRFKSLSSGAQHTCGLTDRGEAVCWGCENRQDCATPQGPFTQISAGHNHTCGLYSNGAARCWGSNDAGQSTVPNIAFQQISAGWSHTCGIDTRGQLHCWGCDTKLSNLTPETTNHCSPPDGQFSAVSAGDLWNSCALRINGQAICWGGLRREKEPQ